MTLETLENPVTGETMHVLESNADTFVIEYALRPHGRIPLELFHPNVEQEFAVKSGEMHVTIDGEHLIIKAGEKKSSPPNSMHFQWNPHDEEVVAVETYRPAGRNHAFFKTLFRLAREGFTDQNGMPNFFYRIALFYEFDDTIRPAEKMPRLMISLLGPLAVALGYGKKVRALGNLESP